MLLKIIVGILLISATALGQFGEVDIKIWEDDKKSAYTFTLDDGLASQVEYGRSILDAYDLRATFMVIADHLNEVPPGQWRYTTWSVLRELSINGHEIGSHSLNHPDLTQIPFGDSLTPGTAVYEIYRSGEKINQKILSGKCFSFAYPLSSYNDTIRAVTSYFYEAARGAGYDHNVFDPEQDDFTHIKSVAPLFDMPRNTLTDDLPELEYHKSLVDSAIINGGWMLSMVHEIVPQSEMPSVIALGLWNPMSSEWFNLLAGWLQQKSQSGEVWIATMKDVSSYIKERSTFSSSVISQTETEIKISVTDLMDDAVYNYPLTADISIPANWTTVRIIQGSRNEIRFPFQSGGKFYVRARVIPDGGELILLKQDAAGGFSINGKINYYGTGKPVAGTIVVAKGINNFQASGVTDEEGLFSIDNIPPGNYSVTFSKSGNFSGVNSTDALAILRNISGTGSFDLIHRKAADVDKSNIIDKTDADLILNRFIHLIELFDGPDWLFFPENQEVTIINQNITFDTIAIQAGDVTP